MHPAKVEGPRGQCPPGHVRNWGAKMQNEAPAACALLLNMYTSAFSPNQTLILVHVYST